MGRKPRFEYPGGIYHIIQRGNNREYIFDNNEDKEFILSLLYEYSKKFKFDIYGYVIMSNHYHLIIKPSDTPLKDIMHRINNKFSRDYNKKYKRTGHVFENRYKGILVIDHRYLLSLLRYVHQNPVVANICQRVSDYTWSSDRLYRSNNIQNGIVDIDFILNIFSENRAEALKAYIAFMDEDKNEDMNVFEKVDKIGEVNTKKIDEYIKSDIKPLDQILREIAKDEQTYNEIRKGSRERHLSAYKKEFIETALKFNYTMDKIGKSISISGAAVYKIHKEKK